MSLLQPTDAKGTRATTPSPAEQEMAKYRLQVLAALLNARSGPQPGFKDFVSHGTKSGVEAGLPPGLSGGLSTVLEAMKKPGAFTSRVQEQGHGVGQSGVQDIASTILLGLMLKNAMGGTSAGNAISGGASDLWNRFFGSSDQQIDQTPIDWQGSTPVLGVDQNTPGWLGDSSTIPDTTTFDWGT